MDRIFVKSLSGKLIPLNQLASIEFKESPGEITRYNLERTALIMADVERGANIDDIMKPVIQKQNDYNFIKTQPFVPVETSRAGIFTCGCVHEPMDIPRSVAEASGAAARAAEVIRGG